MKRLSIITLMVIMAIVMKAQGWPENYGGVMLQGFYWDSYNDTKWDKLTSQVDELSSYFNLIWVPNSGQTKPDGNNTPNDGGYYNMGYMPVFWLKHNTCFGDETTLKNMIAAFKARNTYIIEDVVINHKNGCSNWADFPDETVEVGDKTYTLEWADASTPENRLKLWGICKNDELFSNGGHHGNDYYWYTEGTPTFLVSYDEGDNFDGCRDLDHTNVQVQANVATYLDYLVNELGYAGFRYDMVKGYAGYYVGKYNSEVPWPTGQNMFSVGEYWDASYDNVVNNWIWKTAIPNGTIQSAAFDFPLKYALNDAFNNWNWSVLQGNKGIAGNYDMKRYSVTFVDNHDTYRNDYDRVNNNVLAANAFILGLPGTPCIFLPHWQQYRVPLMKMITARKAAGITNQSTIEYDGTTNGGFYMKVKGQYGSVIVLCGTPSIDNVAQLQYDINNWHELICSGTNFAFYLSNNDGIYNEQTYRDIEENNSKKITVYVRDDGYAPYIYAWGSQNITGSWPGCPMVEREQLSDGFWWYKMEFKQSELNIQLNNGGKQTPDILNLKNDIYLRLYEDQNGNLKFHDAEFIDGQTESDYIYAFFENTPGWNPVKAYTWNSGFYNGLINYSGSWSGTAMTQVGTSSSGKDVYLWRIPKTGVTGVPNKIIFTNGWDGDYNKTGDMNFVNGGFYTKNGNEDYGGLTSADMISLDPVKVLEGVEGVSATNWDGESGQVAQPLSSGDVKIGIYFPAGSYTVQAIVRGTNGSNLTLTAGTSSSSVSLTGTGANSPSTVTTTGVVEPFATGSNGGWHKVQSTYTLAEDGVLRIALSSDAATWQIGDLVIIKDANATGKYQTIATTQTTQTNVDVTSNNKFSFFDRGANPNALIKANSGQDAAKLPYNVIVGNTCANLRLTDGAYDFNVNANQSFTANAVSYDRVFTPNKKVTVCLPFAISEDEMSGMDITAYELSSVDNGTLHFTSVSSMAANTPYLVVVGENGTTPFIGLESRTISPTNTLEVPVGNMTFKGTMKRLTLNSSENVSYYGYSNGEFVKAKSNVSINPFRAFITTNASNAGASLSVTFEDVSAIHDISSNTQDANTVYTLDGRRITNSQQLPKGIYIKGGKKLIIK